MHSKKLQKALDGFLQPETSSKLMTAEASKELVEVIGRSESFSSLTTSQLGVAIRACNKQLEGVMKGGKFKSSIR